MAVIGSVNGEVEAVFSKLAALHAKNNFSFAIVAGTLFDSTAAEDGDSSGVQGLLSGKIEVPLPTYFAVGTRPLPQSVLERLLKDGEVCPNLFCLRRRSTLKTSEGVRIVALGGEHQPAGKDVPVPPPDDFTPLYTDADAKLLKGATSADIIITTDWPKDILTGSALSLTPESAPSYQQSISDLVLSLKPRYHFSTCSQFHEREPFFHPKAESDAGFSTTRFISLAPYGNPQKSKWIYAFTLDTSAPLLTTIPAGVTACPLVLSAHAAKRKVDSSFARFDSAQAYTPHQGRGKKRRALPPPGPRECFFCLSSPAAATHIIASIGEASYLTTARGPLTKNDTFPALGGWPGHVLVIPFEHAPTLSSIYDRESRGLTRAEMKRYKGALDSMLAQNSGEERLGSVAWEVSRIGGVHFHWQWLPCPVDLIERGLVKAGFEVQAENESYPRFETEGREAEEGMDKEDYFRVWINGGDDKETVMTLVLDSSFRFDLQFGRKVMAKLLGLEARSDWRDCGQSVDEETSDADSFKVAFKDFDFT